MKSIHLLFSNFCVFTFFIAQQFHSVNCEVPHLQQPVYDSDGNIKFFPRIVGGTKAHEGDVRGIVSIQTWKNEHICGGTWFRIGNKTQILTAAHCVIDSKGHLFPKLLLQIMGDDLSISKSPGLHRQMRKVRKIVPHPYYNPENLQNDIAMIFLTTQFKETRTFAPIQLATRSVVDNQACNIAGWGYTAENGVSSIELLMANVSVVPREICNGAFSYNGRVGPYAFCAGSMGGGIDTCQGDSGGGITSQNQLVGVVSFGVGCGRRNFPGVYTNAYHYRGWIEKTINASPAINQSTVLMLATVFAAIFARSMF
ncbi:trypsin eta-like [Sitodiplosis mosellana]|uniref:trypsin eta-like n=1 Tax=Sitodiplosis mosellana TaxID=263140 RepID=UPI0024442FF3|nr:trypsin eta-like [Sitodiplosis mosellana]